jgi:hypothetical protein
MEGYHLINKTDSHLPGKTDSFEADGTGWEQKLFSLPRSRDSGGSFL